MLVKDDCPVEIEVKRIYARICEVADEVPMETDAKRTRARICALVVETPADVLESWTADPLTW